MDFSMPQELLNEVEQFKEFLREKMEARLDTWYGAHHLPKEFFEELGRGNGYGFRISQGRLVKASAFREALFALELARRSPGAAIAALAHADLGMMGLSLFGSPQLHRRYAESALAGETVMSQSAFMCALGYPARGDFVPCGKGVFNTNLQVVGEGREKCRSVHFPSRDPLD